jgi:hypothetical protein
MEFAREKATRAKASRTRPTKLCCISLSRQSKAARQGRNSGTQNRKYKEKKSEIALAVFQTDR